MPDDRTHESLTNTADNQEASDPDLTDNKQALFRVHAHRFEYFWSKVPPFAQNRKYITAKNKMEGGKKEGQK